MPASNPTEDTSQTGKDPTPAAPRIAAADRVPATQKLAFSAGYCVDYLAYGLTASVLWMPFFNIGLGISPAILGIILMILRAWDAFLDPAIGNISDNTRTRWGRRRPYIFVGAILTAGLYLLLWRLPIHLSSTNTILLLGLLGILFSTAFALWSTPFYGLQMELTPSYDERTRLAAWVAVAGKFVYFGGGWVLAIASSAWFVDQATGKPDIVHGMKTISWFIAGLIVILGIAPALFVKERYYKATAAKQNRDPFWQSLWESFHCRPLWNVIGISCFLVLGSSISNTLGQYVNIYYVNEGRAANAFIISGWKSTLVMIVGVTGIPIWTWLSERLDKKTIVAIMLGGTLVGHLLNIVCLRPDMPYLQLLPAVFETGAIGAVWLFVPSMKGDVADHDETITKRRREGSLSAVYSWFAKAGSVTGAGLGGLVMQMTGFDATLSMQSPDALSRMRILFIVLPILFWGCTLLFIWKYPLNRARMTAIRAELEATRGKV
ncbi:MAG: hypothetical protein B9S32_10770 [Verrucomicrobia bacterium Tous-C9LFEB]|nr:MAG: hypothetical protein B9S32_10770 [Verrucomicrobia bacterium Tous-C9LFEB]